jgi:hypothetical protein
VNAARFYRLGRGAYLEGLRRIAESSPGGAATVASDNDFRNQMLVDYYRRFLPAGDGIRYVPTAEYPREGADWIIVHHIGPLPDVPKGIYDRYRNDYALRWVLPYADLSGWHWMIYRRLPPRAPGKGR